MLVEFICKMCDFTQIYEKDDPHVCPACGSKWYTIYFRNAPGKKAKFVNLGYKDTPRYSASLGVLDEDLPAARKASPQCEWKRFGNSWRPLIKNRTDKKRLLKQNKMTEYS